MLVALLLATLAPGLARALAQAQGDLAPWSVVCAQAGSASPTDGEHPPLTGHCLFCGSPADALGPPMSPGLKTQAMAAAPALPPLFLHARHALHAWAAAQPRAPPTAG